jgi:hypothetical protein
VKEKFKKNNTGWYNILSTSINSKHNYLYRV